MKTIITIMKKEFARFFKDVRLMLTTLILPGLLIFCIYSLIGTITQKAQEDEAAKQPTACIRLLPESQSAAFSAAFDTNVDYADDETAMADVKAGKLDIFIAFPQGFDQAVADYRPSSGEPAPNITIYYNSGEEKSYGAYAMATAILSKYEESIANKFDIGGGQGGVDLADAESISRTVMSTVVPMVLLMLLFSGCMAVAPEAIAGEKERGTIATLLVTPVKRSHVAVGKIAALSVIALLSGLSSALGLILSLPKLAGGAGGITLSMYGFAEYASILAIILSTVLILVSIIAIISAFSKSVKEASGMVVPVMILVMLCGLMVMFAPNASLGLCFIPLFNSALSISQILGGSLSAAGIAATVCVNVVFAAALIVVLALMFNSERIMFNR